jgi:hypothetical protein
MRRHRGCAPRERIVGGGREMAARVVDDPADPHRIGTRTPDRSATPCDVAALRHGLAYPAARSAETTVFASSIVIVIGPTPPGTGVM